LEKSSQKELEIEDGYDEDDAEEEVKVVMVSDCEDEENDYAESGKTSAPVHKSSHKMHNGLKLSL
jgi:hypothetical protein